MVNIGPIMPAFANYVIPFIDPIYSPLWYVQRIFNHGVWNEMNI